MGNSYQFSNNGTTGWVTDTVGRTIPVAALDPSAGSAPRNPGCYTLYYPGPTGATWPFVGRWRAYTFTTSFQRSNVLEYSNSIGPWNLLQSVTLPNGTSWTFTYDNFGSLKTVTLPTGGTTSYTYQQVPSCDQPSPNAGPPGIPAPWG